MKKIVVMWLGFLLFMEAQTLQKASGFIAAQEQAIKENKQIMVLITTQSCRYCIKMKKTTFSIPKVIERIEKNYVFVEVDRDLDVYPKHLTVYGVPTTYFLYSDGTPIIRPAGGYWNSVDFLSFMDDADTAMKKQKSEDK